MSIVKVCPECGYTAAEHPDGRLSCLDHLRARAEAAEKRVAWLEAFNETQTGIIADYEKHVAQLEAWPALGEDDRPLPEDEQIATAHPTRTGQHATYEEAMRLVGARRSKMGLVTLVNWLLVRMGELERKLNPPCEYRSGLDVEPPCPSCGAAVTSMTVTCACGQGFDRVPFG